MVQVGAHGAGEADLLCQRLIVRKQGLRFSATSSTWQPGVELGLQRLDTREQLLVDDWAEEFLQHGAVEALDEAVGAWAADLGLAMLDLIERQVELIGMALGAAEFADFRSAPPSPADRAAVERQHIVVQDRDRGFRLLADMGKPKA